MKLTEEQDQHGKRYELNNVVEAFSLIGNLLDNNGKLGLTQLSNQLRFSKNKTFRLLTTLESRGFIEKDAQSRYSIGFAAFEAARKIMSKISILDRIRPYLKDVAGLVNESAYYAYIDAEGVLLVDYIDCTRPIKAASLVGRSIPLPGGDPAGPVPRVNAIGDVLVDVGGFDSEVTAVVAPIDIYTSKGRGAIVVVAPSYRMPALRIKTEIVPAVRTVLQRHSLVMSQVQRPASNGFEQVSFDPRQGQAAAGL